MSEDWNVYRDVGEWVTEWLAPALAFRVGTPSRELHWCPQWWRHPAVSVRLDALWQAWEAAVAGGQPGVMSTWWIQHADPHLRIVCDGESGPMRSCSSERHVEVPELTVVAPPLGWFTHHFSTAG